MRQYRLTRTGQFTERPLVEPHGFRAVAPPRDFGVTRRSVPSFAPTSAKASVGRRSFSEGGKATEGYPTRIHPRVNTRGLLRRRVGNQVFSLPDSGASFTI